VIYVITRDWDKPGEDINGTQVVGLVVGTEAEAQAVVDRLDAHWKATDHGVFYSHNMDAEPLLSLNPDGTVGETYQRSDPA
jgi:hypothetical protein